MRGTTIIALAVGAAAAATPAAAQMRMTQGSGPPDLLRVRRRGERPGWQLQGCAEGRMEWAGPDHLQLRGLPARASC